MPQPSLQPHERGHPHPVQQRPTAYAPARNPVERFFRELRRALEGRVYPDLQAKQEALEPILKAWQADPKRVRQLCGWRWIRDTLTTLADDTLVTQS